ncbi:hypothetical protein GGC03_25165 (plasmid) [Vibrio sp. THAF191c]|nr:hypothetical protein FIU99_25540 [Vibrio sp. THAF64]QGM37740.1 hypothetical protein GGC04_25940 [Vibrio sp. THAF191d]QGN73083.1 hypothetical protein GGC03_25165 [Vibrio sp. THAF191c]
MTVQSICLIQISKEITFMIKTMIPEVVVISKDSIDGHYACDEFF